MNCFSVVDCIILFFFSSFYLNSVDLVTIFFCDSLSGFYLCFYMEDLSYSTNETSLRKEFSNFGQVVEGTSYIPFILSVGYSQRAEISCEGLDNTPLQIDQTMTVIGGNSAIYGCHFYPIVNEHQRWHQCPV